MGEGGQSTVISNERARPLYGDAHRCVPSWFQGARVSVSLHRLGTIRRRINLEQVRFGHYVLVAVFYVIYRSEKKLTHFLFALEI